MAKKKISAFKMERCKTGGGPSPQELPDIIQRIWDMLPSQFERIENPFDDDAIIITVASIINGKILSPCSTSNK